MISSQPRYDRFDTSPYIFNSCPRKANLWELSLGTAKIVNIQFFKKSSYTADLGHFLKRIFPKVLFHFECRTFDLSDNSPRVYFNLFFRPIKIHSKNFWEEKQERKLKIIRFSSLKTSIKSRFFYRRNYQTVLNFRVRPVMTASILLRI